MKNIFTILFLSFHLFSVAQEKVVFEDRQISMIPPIGFVEVDFFTGFFNYSNGSSIQIEPVDSVAYLLVAQGFTKEVLEPQGVTFISKEDIVTPDGRKGILVLMQFQVTQNHPETGEVEVREYERLSFLTGDMNRTIYISANYPLIVKDLVFEAIRQSLFTAKFEN